MPPPSRQRHRHGGIGAAAGVPIAEEASPKEIKQVRTRHSLHMGTPHAVNTPMCNPNISLLQMWESLERQAREALEHANQRVPEMEAAERAARSMRIQADVAERCHAHCTCNEHQHRCAPLPVLHAHPCSPYMSDQACACHMRMHRRLAAAPRRCCTCASSRVHRA